jgi:oligosaccharyltransferase complex subunit beta
VFSNRFFNSGVQKAGSPTKHDKSGNEQFFTELSKWVLHERGHLKAVNVQHHKVGETNEPSIYRINDDLEYSVEIYEWSGTSWEPYVADDVQVQFYMMSPYVLKTLSNDKKGRFFTSFKVPDVYGVFQFKVEYDRLGYTSLSLSKQIPVRPFKHNEYERFIPAAYPYYGAAFSMMAGFFVFSAVHLYNK